MFSLASLRKSSAIAACLAIAGSPTAVSVASSGERVVRIDLSGDRFVRSAELTIQRAVPYSDCCTGDFLRSGENHIQFSPGTYRLAVTAPRDSMSLPDNLRSDEVIINVPSDPTIDIDPVSFHFRVVPCIVAIIHVLQEPEPCDSQIALIKVPDEHERLPESWNVDAASWAALPVGTPARVYECESPGRWALAFRRRGDPRISLSAPVLLGQGDLKYIILDV